MSVQAPNQQQYTRERQKQPIFIGLAIVFLVGVAVIWVVNIGNVFSGVLSIIFTLLSILLAFLQWQQPRREHQILARAVSQQGYDQINGVALEVNKSQGVLIVYTRKDLRGSTINLSFGFRNSDLKVDLASSVVARKRKGNIVYVAIFPSLNAGNYTVYTDSLKFVTKVSILPGRVEEVDWQ